jgi:hypothetical protein
MVKIKTCIYRIGNEWLIGIKLTQPSSSPWYIGSAAIVYV